MLLNGFQHVAILTEDTDRLHEFYTGVFGATVSEDFRPQPHLRLSFVHIGPHTEFNVFEVEGNSPEHTPMFGRGPIDHFGLAAVSLEAFDEIRARLMARGASEGIVTDFGPVLSLFFRDPDGLEAEVVVDNPDPGPPNPGKPATRYHG